METEAPVSTVKPEDQALIPRMGLRHLMLWMLISGVAMALSNYLFRGSTVEASVFSMDKSGAMQAIFTLTTIAAGGVLTGAIVLGLACLRHQRVVIQAPGHWVALAQSIGFVSLGIFLLFATAAASVTRYNQLMTCFSFVYLLQAALYGLGARLVTERVWRVLLLWMAFVDAISFLVNVLGMWVSNYVFMISWLTSSGRELLSIAMLITAAVEAARGKPRDWIHTVCMLCLLIIQLAYVVSLALFMLGT